MTKSESITGCGVVSVWLIAAFLCVVLSIAIEFVVYPVYLAWQRESVEQSKSYNDSRNTMLGDYIIEYNNLETKIAESDNPEVDATYISQQEAILGNMCQIVNSMKRENVAPNVNQFLSLHGGCQ